jgi:formylglycine-generating enzyme required for sulfatase activity
VSWKDAKAYVTWLSGRTGRGYRLLSEAEREYVTRAGTSTPYWWGSSISTSQADYKGDQGKTVAVDSFEPNPWGIYQVHGNVYDWVEDCWHDDYKGAPFDGAAWLSGDCSRHALRGGSWNNLPKNLRAAFRNRYTSDLRNYYFGFRLVRTLSP